MVKEKKEEIDQKQEVKTNEVLRMPLTFDTGTVLYLIYLLYRTNFLTRQHVKHMLSVINEKHPEALGEYLAREASK